MQNFISQDIPLEAIFEVIEADKVNQERIKKEILKFNRKTMGATGTSPLLEHTNPYIDKTIEQERILEEQQRIVAKYPAVLSAENYY